MATSVSQNTWCDDEKMAVALSFLTVFVPILSDMVPSVMFNLRELFS
jgi:hypothetical protein